MERLILNEAQTKLLRIILRNCCEDIFTDAHECRETVGQTQEAVLALSESLPEGYGEGRDPADCKKGRT